MFFLVYKSVERQDFGIKDLFLPQQLNTLWDSLTPPVDLFLAHLQSCFCRIRKNIVTDYYCLAAMEYVLGPLPFTLERIKIS